MSIMVESKKNGPDIKSAVEPSNKYDGLVWWDTVNAVHKVWKASNSSWVNISDMQLVVQKDPYSVAASAGRGVFGGGYQDAPPYYSTSIEYISIAIAGNSTTFGTLTTGRQGPSSTSNGANDRGVFGGGNTGSNSTVIEYITIGSEGNAVTFGQLTAARENLSATSNGTSNRGVFAGGGNPNALAVIDYITLSTVGNAISFGNLTVSRYLLAACSNATSGRGVFGGGIDRSANYWSTLDYITIGTLGAATPFGNLAIAPHLLGATSNGTSGRGVFGGGNVGTVTNAINYITISTTGNSTSFGQLSVGRSSLAATSNGTSDRGVFGCGYNGTTRVANIDYITISTTGNATSFGNQTTIKTAYGATSNS